MRNTARKFAPSAPIATCREMAVEAEKMAAGASPEKRAKYLDLARQWSELADEMEHARATLEAEDRGVFD